MAFRLRLHGVSVGGVGGGTGGGGLEETEGRQLKQKEGPLHAALHQVKKFRAVSETLEHSEYV